ncbi:hypothetical protein LIER_41707 [Lithospermum erythrorhizon]|uniref:Uncharacterized protein n=1 Tax=Lithospermum erythrorhizon TaxID=34254 RepID=A0AAV3REQ3_LITER
MVVRKWLRGVGEKGMTRINNKECLMGYEERGQRARANWVLKGDLNIKLFHGVASQKRRFNRIEGLLDENEEWRSNMEGIQGVVVRFYTMLFTSQAQGGCADIGITGGA